MAADGSIHIETKIDESGIDKGLGALQGKMDKVGSSMQATGKKLTTHVTAPIVALGGLAFAAANEMDKANNTIRTGTGATGDALDELNKSFKTVFKDVPEDAATVSSALADINTRTGLTGEPLEKMTKQFLDLSRITGEDVSTSIADTTRTMQNWGIENEATGEKMDYLWKVAQTTGIGVADLTKKVGDAGPTLRALGIDFEEGASLMGHWEKAGFDSSTMMTGLDKAVQTFAKDGKNAADELPKLIEQIEGAGSTAEAQGIAMEYFGRRAGPQMAEAIRNGAMSVEELMVVLDESGETIGAAAAETETFGDKMAKLKNQSMTALEPLGKILLDLAILVLGPVLAALSKFADFMQNMPVPIQLLVVAIGGILAAIGPVVFILGTLISSFAKVIPVVTKVFSVMTKLGPIFTAVRTAMALLMGPVGLIIAIVGVLAVVIYKNWDLIKEKTAAVFGWIGDFLPVLWEGIKAGASAFLEFLKNLFNSSLEFISNLFSSIWSGIASFTSAVWSGIVAGVTAYLNAYKLIITTVFNAAKTIITTVLNFLKTAIQTAFNFYKTVITTVLNALKTGIQAAFNFYKNIITSTLNAIKTTVSTVFNAIKSAITTSLNATKSIINSIWNAIRSTILSALNLIKSTVINVFNAMKQAISDAMGRIKSTIKDAFDNVLGTLKSLGTKFFNAGKGLIEQIIKGIKSMIGKVTGEMTNLAGKMRDFLPFSPAKTGPLSDLDKLDFGGPVGDSIKKALPLVKAKMSHLLQMPKLQTPDASLAAAAAGAGRGEGSVTHGDITNHFTIQTEPGQETNVRKLSQELHKLQKRDQRGAGRK